MSIPFRSYSMTSARQSVGLLRWARTHVRAPRIVYARAAVVSLCTDKCDGPSAVLCFAMANLTLRYLDELSYVLNSRRHLASQAKASSVGDLLNPEEDRFSPVSWPHRAEVARDDFRGGVFCLSLTTAVTDCSSLTFPLLRRHNERSEVYDLFTKTLFSPRPIVEQAGRSDSGTHYANCTR